MKIGDFVVDIVQPDDWGVVLRIGVGNVKVLWRDGGIDWTSKSWIAKRPTVKKCP